MKIIWALIIFQLLNITKSNTPSSCQKASISSTIGSKLVAVIVLFRHGDRAPLNSFPNDPYFDEKYWPMGFGQLTRSGIQRAYKLGQWFRNRYGNFLSSIYSPNDIYAWSTDTDRTLCSALAVLAGLYPPIGHQVFNEEINWQPIPVHTVYRCKDDRITERRTCLKFERLFNRALRSTQNMYEKEHQELFNYIAEKAGYSTVTLNDIMRIKNQFHVFEFYNCSFLPDWAEEISNKTEFHELANVLFTIPTSTPTLTRLRIGPFFYKFFEHLDSFIEARSRNSETQKFLILSCHDTCLISALAGMGAYDMRFIGFTDTVIWELKQSSNGKYFVNLLYKHNDPNEEKVEELTIHDCEFNCDYTEFKDKMREVTLDIDSWEAECDEE